MNTSPIITVRIDAVSTCTACGKSVSLSSFVDEEALSTGNATQQASYHAKSLRAQINAAIARRGWTELICGACRDGATKAGLVGIVGETKGNDPKEQRGDDDCG